MRCERLTLPSSHLRQGFVNNDVTEQISALQEKVSKLKVGVAKPSEC